MKKTAHHLKIGKYKLTVFNDGQLYDPENTFDLNCLFIEWDGRKILIDDGCGCDFKGPPGQAQPPEAANVTAGHLVENMAAEGLKPADITDIVFTHTHIDHVSGSFDGGGKAVFPNARYTVNKKEWEYILAGPDDNPGLTWLFAPARKYLVNFKDRINPVEYNEFVAPGIKMIPSPGHTPGNMLIEISSEGQKLLCIGDIIHAYREFTEPEHYADLDYNPAAALKTRKETLAKAAKEGTLVFACHFDFPGLGHIREKKGVLSWEPI
jgi:glyoxylase-like metal-dependent hydrolase (beta-lactamase superfamily II)